MEVSAATGYAAYWSATDRRVWSAELDLVIDRWRMPPELRKNLEDYLRGNYKLRPSMGRARDVIVPDPALLGRLSRWPAGP